MANDGPGVTTGQPTGSPAGTGGAATGSGGAATGTGLGGSPVTWDQVRSAIPQELAGEKVWSSVKDVPGLLKQFVDAQRYIGGAVKIPKPDAAPEERAAFYTKLGRPESPDKYVVKAPAMPEGLEWDQDALTAFRKEAFDAGYTPAQLEAGLKMYANHVRTQVQARQVARDETFTTLREKWGAAFDTNLAFGQAVVKQLGGPKLVEAINNSGIGNNVEFIELMVSLGKRLSADKVIVADATSGNATSAQAEIDKVFDLPVEERKKHPYFDPYHPKHKEWVEKMLGYRQVLVHGS